ncbi:hypothetical protein M0Q97_10825 [Candidatus Dojkabacteria bacterium]|jgi:RNase H-fold protein (predicted Holliday junction resolvase)|nr:hypothetical protein [Candidatus Dojkabacteria bacterium]
MIKIDFENTTPDFINGEFKWYVDKHFQKYIETEQANNLPKLKGFGCFVVKSKDIEDYVLIDNKQNVIVGYPYNLDGYIQIEAKINIIKISKHYDEYEKANI